MFVVFFFNDTATTEIYTLSLHDALPISFLTAVGQSPVTLHKEIFGFVLNRLQAAVISEAMHLVDAGVISPDDLEDRKSTRLNSSHANISYAVFCLKKKTNTAALEGDALS